MDRPPGLEPLADPFAVLGVPRAFTLKPETLRRAWLIRSSEIHPDRLGDDPEAQRTLARLNEAKRLLEDPERRAGVLLGLLGGPSKEQDRTLPEGFLQEILDVRQEMEEALASGDAGRRAVFERWAAERRTAHIDRVGDLFESVGSPPSEAGLKGIRVELNAWRYIERMIEQLDPGYHPARNDFE